MAGRAGAKTTDGAALCFGLHGMVLLGFSLLGQSKIRHVQEELAQSHLEHFTQHMHIVPRTALIIHAAPSRGLMA